MKYDTSPLSIDLLDEVPAPAEDPVRFIPADHDIHQTNGNSDSGPISQATVLTGRNETRIGFDTFIEKRPETDSLTSFSNEPPQSRYRSFVLAGALAVISAFAGGFAVYFLAGPAAPVSVRQPPLAANTAVTDVQPSETFVIKTPTETAGEEPLIPHSPEVAAQRPRPAHTEKTPAGETTDGTPQPETIDPSPETTAEVSSTTIQPSTPIKTSEREAKVGAYVAEKPAGRKPLARCADGTYSFSASKAAACSGRGGVGEWMADGKPSSSTPAKQAAYVLGPRGGCYYLDNSNKKVYVEKKFCQ